MHPRRTLQLALITAIIGEWAFYRAREHAPIPLLTTPSVPPWAVGATFILIALLLFMWADDFPLPTPPKQEKRHRWVWAGLVLVLTVSAVTRLYRIGEIPPGLWLDETDIAKQALRIVQGARPAPWNVARLEVPWLYHYYVALFYAMLGPGYLTVKLPHLLMSVLTGGMLYLLAREFLEEPFALFAALLWATMRWSINMSRWGHANAMAVFWYVTVLWLLWRALRTGTWRYWIATGMALGLSQYNYQSARSLIPLVFIFLVYWRLRVNRPTPLSWRHIVLFLGAFLMIYAPLANTYIHHPNLFLERSKAISIFNPLFTRDPWQALRENVGKYLGMFFYIGDPNGRHNIPGWPVVDALTGILLVTGLARLLRRPRYPQHVLLILWSGAFLMAGILTTEAPNTFRVYGITPALALIAATGLALLYEVLPPFLAQARPTLSQRSLLPASLTLVVIAALNIHSYFAVQATHPAVVGMFNVGPTKVGQYIATLPQDTTIYLDREFWAFSPVEVINPGRPLTRLMPPYHVPPPPDVRGEVVYILGSYGRLLLPYLQRLYPHARVDEGYGPNHTFVYAAVRVPADVIAQRGLRTTMNASEPTVLFPRDVTKPLALKGGLMVPKAGTYRFRVDNVQKVELGIGRNLVLDTPGHSAAVTLPSGLVPIDLHLIPTPGVSPRIRWRLPHSGEWEEIPDAAWYPLDIPAGGLLAQWYEGGGLRTQPVTITHAPLLCADNAGNLATAAMRWTGYIYIATPGTYTFGLTSDDGSRLWIDDQLVVNNWGLHGAGWVDAQVALDAGWHSIRIDYIDNGGSHWFQWHWAPPGKQPEAVPAQVLGWDSNTVTAALTPPPEPQPAIPVVDAGGQVIGRVPVAQARLQDPKFNQPIADANFQKWPMKLGTQMYDHGIGMYGPGEIAFRLQGKYQALEGMVGVDTDTYGDAHTQVQIIGDGRVLWDSGEIHTWDPPKSFHVTVKGVGTLVLEQIEAGHFEGRGDGVDWVNIRLRP